MMCNYRRNPPQAMEWEVDDTGVYLIIGGRRFKMWNMAILANGTRDIMIVEDRGRLMLASTSRPFEGRVLHMPSHDLVIFEFIESLPEPYGMLYLILEVDEELEPLIREISRRWPMACSEEYDAHLGGQYWREQK